MVSMDHPLNLHEASRHRVLTCHIQSQRVLTFLSCGRKTFRVAESIVGPSVYINPNATLRTRMAR